MSSGFAASLTKPAYAFSVGAIVHMTGKSAAAVVVQRAGFTTPARGALLGSPQYDIYDSATDTIRSAIAEWQLVAMTVTPIEAGILRGKAKDAKARAAMTGWSAELQHNAAAHR